MTAVAQGEATELHGVVPAVVVAVAELREQFASHVVEVEPDGAGGVSVLVEAIQPGSPYLDTATWLGFQITSAYPDADVYPHFIGRIRRSDRAAHGQGFAETEWRGRPALQLSRRSNRWNRSTDTAALKAMKVLLWLATR